jgi:endoglucanase
VLIALLCALVVPPVAAAPLAVTDHQAEDASIHQGVVESNHSGYTGAGFVNYDNVTGSYVQWSVTVAQAGSAKLTFRFANGTTANRPMDITVNDTIAADDLTFAATGAWATWQTTSVTVNLRAGANTVRATATTTAGGPNVDRLTVDPGGSTPVGTPTEVNGQLSVCGVKLCNQHGNPIQLRGMSTHGLQWYRDCVTDGSLSALATDWNADIVRISMYIQEGGYETNPRLYTDLVHSIIDKVTARGMYALVDWHMLSPGDPYHNLARAKTFFTEIAQRHNGKNNLLYEIANEPNGVSWSRVRDYAEELIPVIRANDPETPILVGTRAWSSLGVSDGGNETEVVNNPVRANNIMYTFHFYAASHGDEYLNALSRAADRIPMFVTEFGTQTYTGDGGNDFTMSQRYLDLMAAKKISWTNWNFSDDFRSGAVFNEGVCPNGPYTGTAPLKSAGVWIRARINTPDDFPTHAAAGAASRVITVSSIAQLQAAADAAQPGDRIELVDGVYTTSGSIPLRRSGTASAPITVAAQNVGGAEIRGSAGFSFADSDHVVVEGFRLRHGGSVSVPAGSHHVRLTRNVVQLSGSGNWVTVTGNDVEVDHNTFQNKSTTGVFLQISGPGDAGMAQRTRVHHNHFRDHTFTGDNGGESIRLGYSFRQLASAGAVVEYNLFERANGDSEAISVKSSDNVIRYNTIRDSRGSIVLRHGNRNLVEGNLMLGNTAGLRFYDNDHVLINNVIQGGTGQIIAGSGTVADDTTGSTAHARPDRVLVAFNTVVGNRTNLVQVGQGTDRLGPNECTFANNIVVGGGSGALLDIDEGTGLRWQGNVVWAGTGGNAPSSGYRTVNPALVTDAGGLLRLSADSPAIDTAAGSYAQATRDVDLQTRSGTKDVGADEYATGAQRRPLTTADVGPNA